MRGHLIFISQIEMHFNDHAIPTRFVRLDSAPPQQKQWRISHEFMTYDSDANWANQYTFRSLNDAAARGVARLTSGARGDGVWVLVKGKLRSELYALSCVLFLLCVVWVWFF